MKVYMIGLAFLSLLIVLGVGCSEDENTLIQPDELRVRMVTQRFDYPPVYETSDSGFIALLYRPDWVIDSVIYRIGASNIRCAYSEPGTSGWKMNAHLTYGNFDLGTTNVDYYQDSFGRITGWKAMEMAAESSQEDDLGTAMFYYDQHLQLERASLTYPVIHTDYDEWDNPIRIKEEKKDDEIWTWNDGDLVRAVRQSDNDTVDLKYTSIPNPKGIGFDLNWVLYSSSLMQNLGFLGRELTYIRILDPGGMHSRHLVKEEYSRRDKHRFIYSYVLNTKGMPDTVRVVREGDDDGRWIKATYTIKYN